MSVPNVIRSLLDSSAYLMPPVAWSVSANALTCKTKSRREPCALVRDKGPLHGPLSLFSVYKCNYSEGVPGDASPLAGARGVLAPPSFFKGRRRRCERKT